LNVFSFGRVFSCGVCEPREPRDGTLPVERNRPTATGRSLARGQTSSSTSSLSALSCATSASMVALSAPDFFRLRTFSP